MPKVSCQGVDHAPVAASGEVVFSTGTEFHTARETPRRFASPLGRDYRRALNYRTGGKTVVVRAVGPDNVPLPPVVGFGECGGDITSEVSRLGDQNARLRGQLLVGQKDRLVRAAAVEGC